MQLLLLLQEIQLLLIFQNLKLYKLKLHTQQEWIH